MGYFIGYIGMAFLIAFLIVYFGMRKGYEKKHSSPMSNGQVAVRTIGIGLVLLMIMFLGGAS